MEKELAAASSFFFAEKGFSGLQWSCDTLVTAMVTVDPPSKAIVAGVLARFVTRARRATELRGAVDVLLTDDATICGLNRSFRGKNKPTDVLSFPAFENAEKHVGDLAVSLDTANRQALEHDHALDVEVRILVLHGLLHLAGFDHERDKGEMAAREAELREELGLPMGLIARTLTKTKAKKAKAKKSRVKTSAKKAATKKSKPKKKALAPAKRKAVRA